MGTSRRLLQSLCLSAGALLFVILSGCAQNPVSGKNDFVMMNEDSEISIGRENHPKIIAQYGRYEDEALQRYVQSVGDKLAVVSHRDDLIYRFTVLDSPVINAFALPGGYIYITRGLMAYLNSEAELAAVLGHEIGHVTARHGVRQQSAAQAANIGYMIGAILVPELGQAGSRDLFNVLGGALLSGYGREHELESDGLGAEYLARAGYEPQAMLDVIRVLKNQASFAEMEAKKQGKEPQAYHGVFASHPDNDTRLQNVVLAANQYKMAGGKVNRDVYLNHIDGMAFGDSAKQGVRHGRHFYHADMGFVLGFPLNWQINNQTDRIQAIADNGEAFIEVLADDLNRRLTPLQFIQQRLGIEDLKGGMTISPDGLEGYTAITEIPNGGLARISVVYLDTKAFIFLSGSKEEKQFSQFDVDFLATVNSFHRLKQDEMALAQGQKIVIKTVGRNESYTTLSAQSPISNSPLLQLRLLNGHYPDGNLSQQQKVKLVQ